MDDWGKLIGDLLLKWALGAIAIALCSGVVFGLLIAGFFIYFI